MTILYLLLVIPLFVPSSVALDTSFYDKSCPDAVAIVKGVMKEVVAAEPRMGASILRMHFHDCFVQLGGTYWDVPLGRKDATSTSIQLASVNLPKPSFDYPDLVQSFAKKGLTERDLLALSGAHTIGYARCGLFKDDLNKDKDVNGRFAQAVSGFCGQNISRLLGLDYHSASTFDNGYYSSLIAKEGLLHSDRQLLKLKGEGLLEILYVYASNATAFFQDFVEAMLKMSSLPPPAGLDGQIRSNCRTS